MRLLTHGAQRASRRSIRFAVAAMLVAVVGVTGLATPPAAQAAAKKVVIIVGPVGSKTADYKYNADKLAAQAKSYGAAVYKVYSPYATWSNVKRIAQGANLLIYLGHGNGWPSPYCCFQTYTKDGFGLNATSGDGNSNVKYWGEHYIRTYIRLAPNAVVFMNRLCYASGNSEPGKALPTLSTAIKRVDNYGAGFLGAGAKAVFSYGINSGKTLLYNLFKTNRRMGDIFWIDPAATYSSYRYYAKSSRTSGAKMVLDPAKSGYYYRSLIGSFDMTAKQWRG